MVSEKRLALYIYPKGDTFQEALFLPDGSSLGEMDLFTLVNKYQKSLPVEEQPFSVGECIEQFHLSVFGADHIAKTGTQVSFVPFQAADSPGPSPIEESEYDIDSIYGRQSRVFGDSFIRESIAVNRAIGYWLYLEPGNRSRAGSAKKPLPAQRFAEFFRIGRKEYVPLKDTEDIIRDLKQMWFKIDRADPEKNFLKYSRPINEGAREIEQAITLHFAMDYRLGQLQHTSTVVNTGRKDVRAKVYLTNSRNGLFPLLWAELEFALDNNIFVRECKECNKLFALPRGRLKQLTCTGYKGGCGRKITAEKKNKNPYHKEIQRLMTRRTRTRSPEDKEALTLAIEALRAKARGLDGHTGLPTEALPVTADR